MECLLAEGWLDRIDFYGNEGTMKFDKTNWGFANEVLNVLFSQLMNVILIHLLINQHSLYKYNLDFYFIGYYVYLLLS